MKGISIYLNFKGNAQEAFTFYKSVFNTDFDGPIRYFGEIPNEPDAPELSEEEKKMVLHVSMPIFGEVRLMGTDMLESRGQLLKIGNNTTINLDLDSNEEADRLYALLSQGATECAPMREEFFGYWGTCLDRFGVRWMLLAIKPHGDNV